MPPRDHAPDAVAFAVHVIDVSTCEDLDQLLEDLLEHSWPTKRGQDN